jgi:hypothetical protein
MEGSLFPSKLINGITFLMPNKRSPLRNKIVNFAYSDKPNEDANEAIKLINSLIIPDIYPTLISMRNSITKKQSIGNRNKIKFEVDKDSTESSSILFKNGLKIAPAEDFKPLKKEFGNKSKENISVWNIISGEPPLVGEKYDPPKVVKKVGGDQNCELSYLDKLSESYRAKFAEKIELSYIDKIMGKTTYTNNPYLAVVLKLLQYLDENHHDQFIKVKPILDIDPIITFYILIEPYKTEKEYILSDTILTEQVVNNILDRAKHYRDASNEYKIMLSKITTETDVHVFNNPVDVIDQINIVRNRLLHESDPRDINQRVLDIYHSLESTNCINGLGPIFPKQLYLHYSTNEKKRLWQDECRYIIGQCITTMKAEPEIDSKLNAFINLCNTLKEQLPGNKYADELIIMNEKTTPLDIYFLKDKLKLMRYFISSTDFIFFTNGLECVIPNAPTKLSLESISPFYNRNNMAYNNLENTRMVNSDEIDLDVAKAVKKYIRNGKKLEDIIKVADTD